MDIPDENSSFRFIPLLKPIENKKKEVYNQESVAICSTKAISSKIPMIYIIKQRIFFFIQLSLTFLIVENLTSSIQKQEENYDIKLDLERFSSFK